MCFKPVIDAAFRICQRLGQFIGLDQQLSTHSRRLLNINGLLLSQFPHAGRLHAKPLSPKKNHHKTPHKPPGELVTPRNLSNSRCWHTMFYLGSWYISNSFKRAKTGVKRDCRAILLSSSTNKSPSIQCDRRALCEYITYFSHASSNHTPFPCKYFTGKIKHPSNHNILRMQLAYEKLHQLQA